MSVLLAFTAFALCVLAIAWAASPQIITARAGQGRVDTQPFWRRRLQNVSVDGQLANSAMHLIVRLSGTSMEPRRLFDGDDVVALRIEADDYRVDDTSSQPYLRSTHEPRYDLQTGDLVVVRRQDDDEARLREIATIRGLNMIDLISYEDGERVPREPCRIGDIIGVVTHVVPPQHVNG